MLLRQPLLPAARPFALGFHVLLAHHLDQLLGEAAAALGVVRRETLEHADDLDRAPPQREALLVGERHGHELQQLDRCLRGRLERTPTQVVDVRCRDRRALLDVTIDGRPRKVVAQLSKQGFCYVFDRVTGEPIWPIVEKPVPVEPHLPGERPAPTQPHPTRPAPLATV